MSISTKDVERLMKKCQVGVGGRNALEDAHSIMAECYGTLGALLHERDELLKGHQRYETARRMSPQQWKDAWHLNVSSGKPFDEIIDGLRPFYFPSKP